MNQSNLRRIARSLFKDNLIRGRGILADAVIRAQIKSPIKTNVYAALVCIINKTFPEISLLICKRVIFLYRKSFLADDRKKTFITIQFLAHLINQKVVCVVLILMNKIIPLLFSIFLFSYMKKFHLKYSMFYFTTFLVIVLN